MPSTESSKWRMPAEWEPHAGTWLGWPHNETDWPGRFAPIPWAYFEIVRHLSRVERVRILVRNAATRAQVRSMLKKGGVDLARIDFIPVPTNRGWTRDFGPIFVRHGARGPRAIVNFRFNAWAKYPDHELDDRISALAAKKLRLPLIEPVLHLRGRPRRFVLEGGAIDVNGQGCVLTTEECLLSKKQERNPGLSRADIEQALTVWLGVKKVLWLGRGIAGDDTHGHVDDIARFVGPRTVVAAVEENRRDPNHAPLKENLARLRSMTDQDGRKLEIVPLPMPRPIVFDGQRVPASYANFYIANGLVLVPTFNDPSDREALTILARVFPKREVVGVHCGDLIWGLGTLHCLTHEEPR